MDRVALVTGAAGALGRAVAGRHGAQAWRLIVVSRDAVRLTEAYGDEHLQLVGDCSEADGARAIFEQAGIRGAVPEALAHCVGNIRLGALHRMRPSDYDDCLRAKLTSAFHTSAAFVAALRGAGRGGAAVLVSSAAARVGTPNHEAVAAAKGGVEGLAQRGWCEATLRAMQAKPYALTRWRPESWTAPPLAAFSPEPAREAAARQYPLGGIGGVDELAELMVWLLSHKSARVTGQVWSLDGGFSAIRPLVR